MIYKVPSNPLRKERPGHGRDEPQQSSSDQHVPFLSRLEAVYSKQNGLGIVSQIRFFEEAQTKPPRHGSVFKVT